MLIYAFICDNNAYSWRMSGFCFNGSPKENERANGALRVGCSVCACVRVCRVCRVCAVPVSLISCASCVCVCVCPLCVCVSCVCVCVLCVCAVFYTHLRAPE